MQTAKLFMVLLGATPNGRNIEQHDIYFGIATTLQELVPEMKAFWPEAKDKIHVDAYRIVNKVGDFRIEVMEKKLAEEQNQHLFFLNLGGYRQNEFEELHYKMLVVAEEKAIAIKEAKETAFYQHTGFKGASSHVDDKYGVDVDDIFEIKDILSAKTKSRYTLRFTADTEQPEDEIVLGYFPFSKLT